MGPGAIDLDQIKNVAAGLRPEDLRHMEKWAQERARLMEEDPLNYGFPPHAAQLRVHRATHDEVFLVAANRWGKSVTGMRESLWRATGTHPHKKIKPHRVIWCGFVDFSFYNKVTKRHFQDWVPKGRLIQFHESEKWAKFKRSDGGTCTVYFLSYESGRESWQGGAVDFVWLDEELPEDIYQEASARLIDTRGQMLMTQTPVSGLGWAYDQIYVPSTMGMRPETLVVQGGLAARDDSREYEVGDSLVPHMDRDQILRFAKNIKNPDERAIRIFGEFKGRSGGVYKMYDPEVHVIPAFKTPRYYEIWGGIDPGFHGFAALFFAMDPKGRVYVVDEYFSQQENHTTRAKALWDKITSAFNLDDEEYFVFYCDTANPQDIMELNSWAQEIGARMVFASLDQGLKAREAGVQRVQEYLHPVDTRATPRAVMREAPPKGEPLLYFFDTLESYWMEEEEGVDSSRVLWEISRYVWRKARRNEAHPKDPDEKSAGGAHALAALRYGIMARMGAPEEPEPDSTKQGWDPMVRRHMEELEDQILAETEGLDF